MTAYPTQHLTWREFSTELEMIYVCVFMQKWLRLVCMPEEGVHKNFC